MLFTEHRIIKNNINEGGSTTHRIINIPGNNNDLCESNCWLGIEVIEEDR